MNIIKKYQYKYSNNQNTIKSRDDVSPSFYHALMHFDIIDLSNKNPKYK